MLQVLEGWVVVYAICGTLGESIPSFLAIAQCCVQWWWTGKPVMGCKQDVRHYTSFYPFSFVHSSLSSLLNTSSRTRTEIEEVRHK